MTPNTETTEPRVGQTCRALTRTATMQNVVIYICGIEGETPAGWNVWGYRQYRNRARIRQTSFPQAYFIPREVAR
jgi:hypothetical protein